MHLPYLDGMDMDNDWDFVVHYMNSSFERVADKIAVDDHNLNNILFDHSMKKFDMDLNDLVHHMCNN